MPRETDRPLSCLFGIIKPSGPTSMDLLDRLKPLLASSDLFYAANTPRRTKPQRRLKPWERELVNKCGRLPPKMGQGGTLDPLAEGVLVVGIHHGTKRLQQFLHCTKEYETTGLLGTATTSYDAKEPVMRRTPHAHVTEDMLREKLSLFRGDVRQLPPLFSALRMDGKRLFEYAREGIPLPRPIEPRNVRIDELDLIAWYPPAAHTYAPPATDVSDDEKALVGQVRQLAGSDTNGLDTTRDGTQALEPVPSDTDTACDPAAFVLRMTVSSGTYVRSIVHDLGTACGSSAHVVRLVRTRQGPFHLDNCIPWDIFEQGIAELASQDEGKRDEHGLREWERKILQYMEVVE